MTKMVTAKKGPVQADKTVKVPLITWGGDVATVLANGGRTTQQGSIFSQKGLSVELFREDNFVQAVNRVVAGETPYLRGTMDMINSSLDALKDKGVEVVVIYQMTWSTGGDTMVVRSDLIKTPLDLKGQYVGLQLYGPHLVYLKRLVEDSGLSLKDVKVRWLRELTIPSYDTKGTGVDPMTAMQRDQNLAAVMVISPDMMALTSGGTIGTGAENSVKNAKLLLSTKTAGRVIADVYAVRKDYFDSHKTEVQNFVNGLMMAEEETIGLYNAKQQRQAEYQNLLKVSAEILRDSNQATADVEGLLADATFVGYPGNVQFFTGQGTERNFDTLTKEAQEALISFGLLAGPVPLAQAKWDYAVLAKGLKDTANVVLPPKFDTSKVEQYVDQRAGTTEGVLFSFETSFKPNQSTFPAEQYAKEFNDVIRFAGIYPGALIVVEGHADPSKFLQEQQKGQPKVVLDQTRQAAKNLSLQRGIAVRDSLISYAKTKNLALDSSQFTVVGAGIERPKFPVPQNESQWQANMRVVFQVIQAEAELDKFVPSGR